MPKDIVYKGGVEGSISQNTIIVPHPIKVAAKTFAKEKKIPVGGRFYIEEPSTGNRYNFKVVTKVVYQVEEVQHE